MSELEESIDRIAAEHGFSGVVRVDRVGETELAKAYGFAERRLRVPNTVETQLALASGNKGMTALTVVSLIEDGILDLTTTARSLLGSDLPLIDDEVTVEQLLAHRSGIGDYLDEDDDYEITDYVMKVPPQELATTEDYLKVLDGFPTKFPPGERFSYCNGGFVVLALIAERAAGVSFYDLVAQRVCGPAAMNDSVFLRSDELSDRAALGYLHAPGEAPGDNRTNVIHLPLRGSGDGGMYSTVEDLHRLWRAFFAGEIVSTTWVTEMVRPRSDVPEESARYGLGFWLHESTDAVRLVGYDAGASCWSVHDPGGATTYTVISNWSDGAFPVSRHLTATVGGG